MTSDSSGLEADFWIIGLCYHRSWKLDLLGRASIKVLTSFMLIKQG